MFSSPTSKPERDAPFQVLSDPVQTLCRVSLRILKVSFFSFQQAGHGKAAGATGLQPLQPSRGSRRRWLCAWEPRSGAARSVSGENDRFLASGRVIAQF